MKWAFLVAAPDLWNSEFSALGYQIKLYCNIFVEFIYFYVHSTVVSSTFESCMKGTIQIIIIIIIIIIIVVFVVVVVVVAIIIIIIITVISMCTVLLVLTPNTD